MKKFLIISIIAILVGTGCSNTTTNVRKDGVCYNRNVQRTFGVTIATNQEPTKQEDCG